VELVREENFILSVADNGVGLCEPIEVHSMKSLGLRLVGIFVEQLDGTISFSNNAGTRCTVKFPLREGD
jgi:two-component sensor histidine kinase